MNFNFGALNNSFLKTRRNHFGVKQMILFMLFGLAFGGFGLFAIIDSRVDESWVKVEGRVTSYKTNYNNDSTTYAAIVSYEVDNQEYTKTSSFSSSFTPQIGSTKEIAYNPSFPDEAKVIEGTGPSLFLYLFALIGLMMFVAGPVSFIKSRNRSKDINSLVQTGYKTQGILVDIQKINNDNRSNTYKVIVSATDSSGRVQNYVSDALTGIGGLAMADFRTNPIPIDVYLDPSNPENYYVDISDIPNLTPQRIAELVGAAANKAQNQGAPPESFVPQNPTISQPPQNPTDQNDQFKQNNQ